MGMISLLLLAPDNNYGVLYQLKFEFSLMAAKKQCFLDTAGVVTGCSKACQELAYKRKGTNLWALFYLQIKFLASVST